MGVAAKHDVTRVIPIAGEIDLSNIQAMSGRVEVAIVDHPEDFTINLSAC